MNAMTRRSGYSLEGWDAHVTEGDSDASRLVLTLSK